MSLPPHVLKTRVLESLVACARGGWSPQDLTHVLGAESAPYVYRAAARVPAHITSPALRKQWVSFPPPKHMKFNATVAQKVFEGALLLPMLKDSELLSGALSAHPSHAPGSAGKDADPKEKYRAKILKLLEKAESTQFEDEADSLIAKAQVLQQRHRIEDVLREESTEVIAARVHISNPYIKHQLSLLSAIAHANGCSCLLLHDRGLATVIGAPDDVTHTVELFHSLNRQCDWHMRHGQGAELARHTRTTGAYRRSFRLSYAARISELLHEANAAGATSTLGDEQGDAVCSQPDWESAANTPEELNRALPALHERHTRAEQTRDRLFPNLRSMSLSMNSLMGVNDGITAAESSHLSGDSSGLAGRAQLPS